MSIHGCCLFLIFLLLFKAHSQETCYYPDGTVAANDHPCLSGAEASFCCGTTAVCASTKVCQQGPDSPLNLYPPYSRGSCTDKTWTSPECPNFCTTENPSSGAVLNSCGSGVYCCETEQNCCDGNAIFSLGSSSILTTIGGAAPTTLLTSSTTTPPTSQLASSSIPPTTTAPNSGNSNSGGLNTVQLVSVIVGPVCALLSTIFAWLKRDKIKATLRNKSSKKSKRAYTGLPGSPIAETDDATDGKTSAMANADEMDYTFT